MLHSHLGCSYADVRKKPYMKTHLSTSGSWRQIFRMSFWSEWLVLVFVLSALQLQIWWPKLFSRWCYTAAIKWSSIYLIVKWSSKKSKGRFLKDPANILRCASAVVNRILYKDGITAKVIEAILGSGTTLLFIRFSIRTAIIIAWGPDPANIQLSSRESFRALLYGKSNYV